MVEVGRLRAYICMVQKKRCMRIHPDVRAYMCIHPDVRAFMCIHPDVRAYMCIHPDLFLKYIHKFFYRRNVAICSCISVWSLCETCARACPPHAKTTPGGMRACDFCNFPDQLNHTSCCFHYLGLSNRACHLADSHKTYVQNLPDN